ncbi:protein-methionine-sulfoxide reductase heme-binding subunit MsrQ [Oxalicibacterium flavum]|uniref:Protein-methionine-sulfoxide reductase heme-binding subunit MsrQ n=1 Tax=Oxalicibacterium flavum TaxID=179467 RepID=A0A8J2UND8_9BURK|nr:protein-methionine-sulfoxide reductase heme-binding subunit MsrQ [Oxalicibacterium flavum]GGC13800.1 protein-methionine-sulfoxide reductase heme-binding subunit MsrQ [Oxalicibacterium flavum]
MATGFNPAPRQLLAIKAGLFVLALLPFGRLLLGALTDALGANPLEFITWNTGEWTLYFLTMTLAVTPLRRWSGWNWLIRLRRMIGLFAFFYAFLHFTAFFWFDHFFDLREMLRDAVRRPFILVGFAAFVLLIPLAVTSTNAMVKRLGGRRWQWLHRLIYVIVPLGLLHFWWMRAGKNNFAEPLIFALIVGFLLAVRVVWAWRKRAREQMARRPVA